MGEVLHGSVRWSPAKSLKFTGMAQGALIGGLPNLDLGLNLSLCRVALLLVATAAVLLFGHSLDCRRKLIHDSFR